MVNGLCLCCGAATHSCSINEVTTLVLFLNADCHSVRHQLKVSRLIFFSIFQVWLIRISWQDLLFSACGLSILSTIICTLSTVTCSIHIFSLDLVHLVSADLADLSFPASINLPSLLMCLTSSL